ncbi:hypothetical protein [Rhizobium rhizogenes]|uniref:hypothetical protein n=1 Tax=Rhizobium rhizogenes TaxID=359 RepID=UPI00157298EB|nr:hypothetical protein [Rhizobium rhizogenes]NTI32866.1 hypothetical protein [Rhizobium rhizogenes]
MEFNFSELPAGYADISIECQRQLLPFVQEIAQAAVAAGWNDKDVLLAIADLAWDLYEKRCDDL